MKKAQSWMVLPAIAGLLIAYTASTQAAQASTLQTTGGGWILPVVISETPPADPSSVTAGLFPAAVNLKANFGFVASGTLQADGVTYGDCQGELSYHDHGIGLRLHSISIDTISKVTKADGFVYVTFTGTADVTNASGSGPSPFSVTVSDQGEPGSNDWFEIRVSTVPGSPDVYHVGNKLGGGNVQVRTE